MKVSKNWIEEYLDFKLPPIDELVTKIGAQLGAVEEVIDIGKPYDGIIIARVVSCKPHPNADKLKVCAVDDGGVNKQVERDEQGYVQVVCGAPNCEENLLVAWIPPGAVVPSTVEDSEPFVIEVREIRGIKSNGMLASAKELAISEDHEGLLVLNDTKKAENISAINWPEFKPGDDFKKALKLDDYVIDIENKMFTHRPDCFGMLGIAREVAGIFNKPFSSPEIYSFKHEDKPNSGNKLVLNNELPELVPRFVAQVFENVQIGPSPIWMQSMLSRVGVRPINNIVDITNYFMLLTGQPLHAYDYDKLKAIDGSDHATITIRHPKKEEELTLLNGKTIKPESNMIMIASASKLIGVGGVMGGHDTEVDSNTKNIVLECAQFDMYSIRRTSMTLGLFTDAVTRFSKGQSPLQNGVVVNWTAQQIINDSGAMPGDYLDNINIDQSAIDSKSVFPSLDVTPDFIKSRLGIDLAIEEMAELLKNVEFGVDIKTDNDTQLLHITAPFWRTDIELPEDIVEEIGRLYGFDKLNLELPSRIITPAAKDISLSQKAEIRNRLRIAGANEVLTYSFVHETLLDKVGQDSEKAFQISNALSPDLQFYRLSLIPSLLDKVHMNNKAGFSQFALFEIGKAHDVLSIDKDSVPKEYEHTALIVTADSKAKRSGAPYYQAKAFIEYLCGTGKIIYKPLEGEIAESQAAKPFTPNRCAALYTPEGEFLGILGEFKPSVIKLLKLPSFSAGFEVKTDVLGRLISDVQKYVPLNRFPSVKQDITLEVSSDASYKSITDFLDKSIESKRIKDSLSRYELLDIYQDEKDQDHKRFTFRFNITGTNRTLTDKEVNKFLDEIAFLSEKEIGARRI
ncbi:MAG: phenylalanine--tRNA ligase subunit beta [Candidatus Saccharimonadales bacterium]